MRVLQRLLNNITDHRKKQLAQSSSDGVSANLCQ